MEVLKGDCNTFDEACQLAERIDRLTLLASERSLTRSTPARNGNGTKASTHSYDGPVPMDLDAMQHRRSQRDRNGRPARFSCWVCGKTGHLARDCWYKPGNSNRGGRGGGASRGRGRFNSNSNGNSNYNGNSNSTFRRPTPFRRGNLHAAENDFVDDDGDVNMHDLATASRVSNTSQYQHATTTRAPQPKN